MSVLSRDAVCVARRGPPRFFSGVEAARRRRSSRPRPRCSKPCSAKVGTFLRKRERRSPVTASRRTFPLSRYWRKSPDETDVGRDLPAEQVLHRRRGAAVGDVRQRNARRLREAIAEELRERARRRASVRPTGLVGFQPAHIVGQRLHFRRHGAADRQHAGRGRQQRDGPEILRRVVGEVGVDVRVDRHRRRVRAQHHAAVRLSRLIWRSGDSSRGPGPVVHEVWPALRAPRFGQAPRGLVERPARRIADDDRPTLPRSARSRSGTAPGRHEARTCLRESSSGKM